MKKIRLLTILSFILGCLLVLACCGKTKLDTPSKDSFLVDETTLLLSWDPVENATGYKVLVNNEEFITTKPRYPLDPLPHGEYTITVQATSVTGTYEDSAWSASYQYVRPVESGLDYVLINNNTEYEVRGIGKASGHIEVGDFYRGRPVTSIGEMAFANKSSSVASIDLGDNIRTIKARAFLNCSMISEIEFPSSITEIGAYAFQGCRGLTEITIPESVTTISNYAFAYCRGLRTISLPEGLTTIGERAFSTCDSLNNVVLPDSVVELGQYAFTKNVGLTTFTFGAGLETIPKYAFYEGENLTNVNFSEGLKTIEDYAFSTCATSNAMLESDGWIVEFPDSLETIGMGAFINSKALASVDFGEGLQSIGNGAFEGTFLFDVAAKLDSGFTFVDGWVLKYLNTQAPTAFPDGTVGIANWAFAAMNGQGELVGVDALFEKSWSLNLPDTVKYIGDRAFSGCAKINRVYIGKATIRIGQYAFAMCTNLSKVIFSVGLKEIDSYAFQGCENLDTIEHVDTKDEDLPVSLERIGTYAFDGTDYWESTWTGPVYIGNWLVGWNEKTRPVEEAIIKDGIVGVADWAFYNATVLHTVEFPSSIEHIGRYAFAYCASLSTIILRPGIEKIDDFTFYQCIALSEIAIPNTVESIGYSAFNKCSSLTSITIPLSVKTIDDYAFFKCTSLASLEFETESIYVEGKGGTQSIGERAFLGCTALTEVALPNSLETLSNRAFYKCTGLKTLSFSGDRLSEIEPYTFYGCTALETVTLPESLKKIGEFSFRNCVALTSINFVDGLETLGRYSFYGCEALETINLPSSLTSFGDYVFRNCNGLKSVVLPASLTTIGKHAFNGANNATIYTEYASRPALWIGQWNTSNRPVVWGCTLSSDKSYVVSFTKSATSIENPVATNGMAAPIRAGYTFEGWATAENGSAVYTMENLTSAPDGTTLYAVWTEITA